MKIATYNLRFGGRANNRVHWQTLIEHAAPDVLLLQETLAASEYLPEYLPAEMCERQKEQICWRPVEGRRWGSGIYVRRGRLTPLPPISEAFAGWVCGAKVEGLGAFAAEKEITEEKITEEEIETEKGLYVYSIHAPSVRSSYVKQVNLILDGIRAQVPAGAAVVIGGDFNLPLGFRHASEAMQQCEPKLMARFRREFGLMNCWQVANPNRDLPQTLRWSKDPVPPFHCDGIFAPGGWFRYLEGAEVLAGQVWDGLSDHNPVVVRFDPPRLPRCSSHPSGGGELLTA